MSLIKDKPRGIHQIITCRSKVKVLIDYSDVMYCGPHAKLEVEQYKGLCRHLGGQDM